MKKIILFLPIYNEEVDLEKKAKELFSYSKDNLQDYDWKIVIGDNASKDSSPEIYKRLATEDSRFGYFTLDRKGRGWNLTNAYLLQKLDYDVLLYMDLDLSTDVKHIKPTIEKILSQEYDIAVGSRLAAGAKVEGRKLLREITSRGYVFILKTIAGSRLSDFQCGFKAMSRKAATEILPKVEDKAWFWDSEMLIIAEKMGYKIWQEPVHWVDDPGTTVNIVKTATDDLKGLYRVMKNHPWSEKPTNFISKYFNLLVFGSIGSLTAIINWAIVATHHFVDTNLHVEGYQIGAFWGYTISAIVNYYLNDRLTFSHVETNHLKRVPRFFFVSLTGLVLSLFLSTMFVKNFGVSPYLVTPIVILLGMVWNYVGHKWVTFR